MLENEIVSQLKLIDNRATLFAGPILDNENDPVATFNEVQIQYPLKFWKIVVANDADQGPVSYGFILDQSNVVNKFGLETLDFSRFKKYQVTIQKITELTGVVFDSKLYDTDILKNTEAFETGLRPFRNSNELLLRKESVLEDKY
jgi:endonuclease G